MSENLEFKKKVLSDSEHQNFRDLFEREVFRIDQMLGIESRRLLVTVGLRKVMSEKYESDEAKELALKENKLHFNKKLSFAKETNLMKGLEEMKNDRPDVFKQIMNILKNDL
ncbi:MAG: hypothetical protein KAU20_05630 [Nanoarchaeota archaeon]|nr:hypothetical protein [Nanoarchaeota archaeon]